MSSGSCERKLEIPFSVSRRSKSPASLGLRISSPTTMTFFPTKAMVAARLEATDVLPSPEVDDVKRMTFFPFSRMNGRFERMVRYTSIMTEFLFSCTTIVRSPCVSAFTNGMVPMTGMSVTLSRSSLFSIRYLKSSRI